MLTLSFFIFSSPEFVCFRNELIGQGRVGGESHGFYSSHEMPVVIVVAVVVSEHPAIVDWATVQVDVGKAIGDDLTIFEPDLFFQNRALAFALEPIFLQLCRSNWWLFLAHGFILAQIGHFASHLCQVSAEIKKQTGSG